MKHYQAALRGEVILMTTQGRQAIQDRLEALRIEKVELERRLGLDARDYPDLCENATYGDLSMKIQLDLPRRVDDLHEMLGKAHVPRRSVMGKIGFDTRFVGRVADAVPATFWLAGPSEVSFMEAADESQVISYLSPLGMAMWGAVAGEGREFQVNNRIITVTVHEILG